MNQDPGEQCDAKVDCGSIIEPLMPPTILDAFHYLSASIAPAHRGVLLPRVPGTHGVSPNPTRSHFIILIILYFYVSIVLSIWTQLRTKYLPIFKFLYNNIICSHFIVLHFSPFFVSGLLQSNLLVGPEAPRGQVICSV